MATKQRLGLRQVRALKPGELSWDPLFLALARGANGARRFRMYYSIALRLAAVITRVMLESASAAIR